MAAKVPSWIERLLLPRLSSMEGELKGFRGEVGGEFKAVHSESGRLDEKIDSLRNEVLTKFDGLEKRLDFAKDFGVLQAKVTELEARLPKA
jgi:predicted nuclease with TOPRIM domain